MTSRTSAPTASQRPATALTKLSLVARKALEAYLIVSAVAASVMSRGAWVPANSSPTRAAAAWSSAPTTMRSGCRLSGTAVPSRRNSGLETTWTSVRPSTRSTTRVDPTGTVDLLTMIVPGSQVGADLGRHGLDVGQVRRAVVALGGGDAQEHELGALDGGRGPLDEAQVAGRLTLADQLLEVLLDDGYLAPLEHGDLGRVGVATGHPMSEVGERGRGGEAHVAHADDGHGVDRSRGGVPKADSPAPGAPAGSPP